MRLGKAKNAAYEKQGKGETQILIGQKKCLWKFLASLCQH
jgi:hypothetical protein